MAIKELQIKQFIKSNDQINKEVFKEFLEGFINDNEEKLSNIAKDPLFKKCIEFELQNLAVFDDKIKTD